MIIRFSLADPLVVQDSNGLSLSVLIHAIGMGLLRDRHVTLTDVYLYDYPLKTNIPSEN